MLVAPTVQQALTLSETPQSVGPRCKPAGDLASLVSKPAEQLMPHLSTVSCWLTLEISHMTLFPMTFSILRNCPHKKPNAKDFFQTTESIFLPYWKLVENSPVFQPTFGCLFLCQSIVATHYNTDTISNTFVTFPLNSLSTKRRNDNDPYLLHQMNSAYVWLFPLCVTHCYAYIST